MNDTTVSLDDHLDMVKWFQSALERKAEDIYMLKRKIASLEYYIEKLKEKK